MAAYTCASAQHFIRAGRCQVSGNRNCFCLLLLVHQLALELPQGLMAAGAACCMCHCLCSPPLRRLQSCTLHWKFFGCFLPQLLYLARSGCQLHSCNCSRGAG